MMIVPDNTEPKNKHFLAEKAEYVTVRGVQYNDTTFERCELRGVTFEECYFERARFNYTSLRNCRFLYCTLEEASLFRCDLYSASFFASDLTECVIESDVSHTDMSCVKGILSSSDWMKANLQKIEEGYVVYKAVGNTTFDPPKSWVVGKGCVLEEVVNPCRNEACGCGVNFGTARWVWSNYAYSHYWKCLIRWEDLPDVVIPYNTDGKGRCARLYLLEQISRDTLKDLRGPV